MVLYIYIHYSNSYVYAVRNSYLMLVRACRANTMQSNSHYWEDNVIPHYNEADKDVFDDYIAMMDCFFSLFLDISIMIYHNVA